MTKWVLTQAKNKTGNSAPPRIRNRGSGGAGKPQKYLYICAEQETGADEIEKLVTRSIPDIWEKVNVLLFTNPEEFSSHAQRILITNVRSVVGICLQLTDATVDDYFEVVCNLANKLLPKFSNDTYPIDLRIALCSLWTFGQRGDAFSISPANRSAWDNFLDIHGQHGESAWDIHQRFQKPLLLMEDSGLEFFIRLMIEIRLDS